ncbi:hypothetical protein P13BB106kb_p004 [Pectobacterium phage DU_PP_V]|uniref:Uncharacterized protein n=1 Tax=Pectobacterium phage DU_PP_V TaxID=2041492 RepID=A0A2D2W6R8_9CAUD|nr:membrane protein [Pectobacterium phage DU_PP_V]ATS93988.1 hypothetical protein P13BB106kb_p004 [Pectobacterium phage DU_PP_V]
MIFYPSESFIFGMFILASVLWLIAADFLSKCNLGSSGVEYSRRYKMARNIRIIAWLFTLAAIILGMLSSLIDIT